VTGSRPLTSGARRNPDRRVSADVRLHWDLTVELPFHYVMMDSCSSYSRLAFRWFHIGSYIGVLNCLDGHLVFLVKCVLKYSYVVWIGISRRWLGFVISRSRVQVPPPAPVTSQQRQSLTSYGAGTTLRAAGSCVIACVIFSAVCALRSWPCRVRAARPKNEFRPSAPTARSPPRRRSPSMQRQPGRS
jgi:hypothetical protein